MRGFDKEDARVRMPSSLSFILLQSLQSIPGDLDKVIVEGISLFLAAVCLCLCLQDYGLRKLLQIVRLLDSTLDEDCEANM